MNRLSKPTANLCSWALSMELCAVRPSRCLDREYLRLESAGWSSSPLDRCLSRTQQRRRCFVSSMTVATAYMTHQLTRKTSPDLRGTHLFCLWSMASHFGCRDSTFNHVFAICFVRRNRLFKWFWKTFIYLTNQKSSVRRDLADFARTLYSFWSSCLRFLLRP